MPKLIESNEANNITLSIRISHKLRRKLQQRSEQSKVTESEYLRRLIDKDED